MTGGVTGWAPRFGGTGSKPASQNGWQRHSRQTVSQLPRRAPCTRSASSAYDEQVGWKRQVGGFIGLITLR